MGNFGGEVTDPKIYQRNFEINENGLLSESIFGPRNDYQCKCGKYSIKSLYEGETCPKCGVRCISNESRFKTFGKISLVFPVIKPTKKKFFNKIVGKAHKHLLDPIKTDVLIHTSRYLAISGDAKNLKIVNSLNTKNMYVVPLRITGIYSLILALRYLSDTLNLEIVKDFFTNDIIMNEIKVLPPDVRPIMRDSTKPNTIRVTETNKPYVSLLQLNKANANIVEIKKEKEDEWLKRIHYSFKNQLDDELVDQLIQEYDQIAARYQFYVDRVYFLVLKSISGKYGFIRSSILGKTIEFSGRSVVAINPSLPPYKIKVSKRILFKLWFPYFLNFMQNKHPEYSYITMFDEFTIKDYDDCKVDFDEFLDWFIKDEGRELAKTIIKIKKSKIEGVENENII